MNSLIYLLLFISAGNLIWTILWSFRMSYIDAEHKHYINDLSSFDQRIRQIEKKIWM
jgi:hypothetical protein